MVQSKQLSHPGGSLARLVRYVWNSHGVRVHLACSTFNWSQTLGNTSSGSTTETAWVLDLKNALSQSQSWSVPVLLYSSDCGSEVPRGEIGYFLVTVNGSLQQGLCWLGESWSRDVLWG